MADARSISEVLQDIVRNIQEIVRSEVRLAKTEIQEEVGKAKPAALLLGGGALVGLYAILFLLFTIFFALALAMPNWAAGLVLGAALATLSAGMLSTGIKRMKRIHPTPERTVETIKENVEWVKQQTK